MSSSLGSPRQSKISFEALPSPKESSSSRVEEKPQKKQKVKIDKYTFDPEIEALGNSLLDGTTQLDEVETSDINDVTLYLRRYKQRLLREEYPDYDTAKQIDDLTKDLQLSSEFGMYSKFQQEKIKGLREKLNEAKRNLEKTEKRRKTSQQTNEDNRNEALSQLEEKQNQELTKLDDDYQTDDLPPRFYKFSPDIVAMRKKEEYLKNAGYYDQAKTLREEIEAVKSYELGVKRNEWEREWMLRREKLLAHHEQQKRCLNERYDLRWEQIDPEYQKKIDYWKKVIDTLQKRLKTERTFKREADREGRATLSRSAERGLPSLQPSTQSSRSMARSRVISYNGTRNFTRPSTQTQRQRRGQSSLG